MEENYLELKQYLNGFHEEMPEAFVHLAEIFKYQAFELCADKDNRDYLIPYMMNDALEYYLILKNAQMTGEYLPEKGIVSAQIAQNGDKYVLILRQEVDNICTLHFKEIEECIQCYQYHKIGHFWVKGQEQWRQLVYIVGTIYDKYEYFGEKFCNKKELEIMNLICFAPFRYWSPIRESLNERYPDAAEGLEVMEQLAAEAGDRGYQRLLKLYRYLPFKCMGRWLARRLLLPGRQGLYDMIWKKVEAASKEYSERDYGAKINGEMKKKRQNVEKKLLKEGYCGKYPVFEKGDTQIYAVEEHPFTIMESKDFEFRIQLMVSEGIMPGAGRNAGFFHGKGYKGRIVDVDGGTKKSVG